METNYRNYRNLSVIIIIIFLSQMRNSNYKNYGPIILIIIICFKTKGNDIAVDLNLLFRRQPEKRFCDNCYIVAIFYEGMSSEIV